KPDDSALLAVLGADARLGAGRALLGARDALRLGWTVVDDRDRISLVPMRSAVNLCRQLIAVLRRPRRALYLWFAREVHFEPVFRELEVIPVLLRERGRSEGDDKSCCNP